MMTDDDKQLLALAAKAVGIELMWSRMEDVSPRRADTFTNWNSLFDDGDTHRLGVRLLLDIRHTADEVSVCALFGEWMTEPVYEDRPAATRRAMTRAAAAIGKAMP